MKKHIDKTNSETHGMDGKPESYKVNYFIGHL